MELEAIIINLKINDDNRNVVGTRDIGCGASQQASVGCMARAVFKTETVRRVRARSGPADRKRGDEENGQGPFQAEADNQGCAMKKPQAAWPAKQRTSGPK